MTHIEELGFI